MPDASDVGTMSNQGEKVWAEELNQAKQSDKESANAGQNQREAAASPRQPRQAQSKLAGLKREAALNLPLRPRKPITQG